MAYFEGVGTSVGKKYGPLPAWAWLGLFAVAAFLYQRRKGGAGATRPETVLPGQSSYYSTISNVNYPPPGPNPEPTPIPGPAMCPPGTTWGRLPATTSEDEGWRCVPINAEDRECPPGQHMECGPGDSPCVCVNNHVRGPLPPSDTESPPIFGPGVPGGGPQGVPAPVQGLVGSLVRLPAEGVAKIRAITPRPVVGAVAGQRMTSFKPSLRPALRAAQQATEDAPGLVGLAALEGSPAGRKRSTMPPALALRQRPAPPRIVDDETQRNVKHQVAVA